MPVEIRTRSTDYSVLITQFCYFRHLMIICHLQFLNLMAHLAVQISLRKSSTCRSWRSRSQFSIIFFSGFRFKTPTTRTSWRSTWSPSSRKSSASSSTSSRKKSSTSWRSFARARPTCPSQSSGTKFLKRSPRTRSSSSLATPAVESPRRQEGRICN